MKGRNKKTILQDHLIMKGKLIVMYKFVILLIVCAIYGMEANAALDSVSSNQFIAEDTIKPRKSVFADRMKFSESDDSTKTATAQPELKMMDTSNHIIVKPIEKRKSIFAWRDSTIIAKRSAYYSLVLPGAGQINNKDYWKVPLVYVAMGAGVYFIVTNNNSYNDARREYAFRLDNPNGVLNEDKYGGFNTTQVGQDRDYYKRFLDISVIATVAIYGLQVMEANVSAHLKGFDVSDDISMQIRPSAMPTPYGIAPGVTFAFNIK